MPSTKKWLERDMGNAIKEVKEGTSSIRAAAKNFLDVSCFGPLKRSWEKVLNQWCITFGGKRPLRKPDFVEKLGECWGNMLTEDNIKAGFRKTGIYPFDHSMYPEK